MAGWRWVLCDATGTPVGEPLATGRALSLGISQTGTASCRIRVGSRLWSEVAAGGSTLKVYDSGQTLRFYGDVLDDELVAEGDQQSVAVTASDLSWRLSKRYTGKDTTGRGIDYTAVDSAAIIAAVLAEVNTEKPTGVAIGTTGSFFPRTMTLLWKRVLDLLGELGAIAGSYEWGLRYTDGTPPTVSLDLLPALGGDQTSLVYFEYGTGKRNCSRYRRVRSIQTSATRVWAVGAGSTAAAVAYNTGAETTLRLEDELSVGDIASTALLDALAAYHVANRAYPKRTIEMTPFVGNAPRYGVDYVIGDLVTARAVIGGTVDTNGAARVWGASISIDELGNETAVPTLTPS
jgi:hypothetical protein